MVHFKKLLPLVLFSFSSFALFSQSTSLKSRISASKTMEATSDSDSDSDKKLKTSTDALEASSGIPNAQVAMSASYYPVTAGDVYTLGFVAGSTPVSYTIPVDSTYKIRVANMGVVNCAGLTYLQLKSQVEALVLRNYPMGGVQFVLTAPSTFLVSVTGEVQATVERNAWALTRLSSFITKSFTSYSSTRNVTIENADGKVTSYDLFLAMRKGDLSQDPFLRPGDKIVVNRTKRTVTIEGAVERPGSYELLDGENLKELIELYGNGLEPLADISRIELTRNDSSELGSGKKIYLSKADVDSNYTIENYDYIRIESFTNLKPVVFIEGAIIKTVETDLEASTRISVEFVPGEDYAFFARRNKNWFTASSDLANAYVIRDTQTIPLNLNPMLYDSSYYTKIEILPNDTLVIPFKQYFVTVAGAVANPGRFPYIPDRTWEYYIGLAGGFDKSRNSYRSVKIIDINGKKLSKNGFITPECTITANTNSFFHYFNQYAPIVTTTLTAIISVITVKTYLDSK